MPWFRNKSASPPPLDTRLTQLTSRVDEMLEREQQQLEACGLPMPPLIEPLTNHYERSYDQSFKLLFTLPKFKLPPYRAFPVRKVSEIPDISWELAPSICYCLLGDEVDLTEVDETFEGGGLPAVVSCFQGVWTSRDPYSLLRVVSNRGQITYERDEWPVNQQRRRIPELRLVDSSLIEAALGQLEERHLFFRTVVAKELVGVMDPPTPQEYIFLNQWRDYVASEPEPFQLTPVPQWLWDNVYLHIQLPPNIFPRPNDRVAYKILPDSATTSATALDFLQAIHCVTYPLRFSLVQDDGEVYFAIACHNEDAASVRRQLALHFPSFTVEPVEDLSRKWIDEHPLYAIEGVPTSAYEFFHGLTDFRVDPHLQLLSVLDEVQGETVSIEIVFAPIPAQTINTLVDVLDEWSQEHKNREAGRRARLMEKKSPAWLTQIRILSDYRETISKIQAAFFQQIEAHRQRFYYDRPYLSSERKYSTPLWWSTMSTEELATLVHFPTFEL